MNVAGNAVEGGDRNVFDTSTNLFTAPADGTYLLGGRLLFKINASATALMSGRLVVNGSTEIRGSFGEISGRM